MATSNSTPSPFNPQSTYVYFIAAGSTPIKIGVSNDPAARLRDLQTAHYQKLHLLYTIECADRAQAFELETAFHRWYDEAHIQNEWYGISPKKIADDIHLLITLGQSIVGAEQYVTPEQIVRMEQRAEKKISRREVGSHVGEVTTDGDTFMITCSECGLHVEAQTELRAKRAMAAHLRKHRNEEQRAAAANGHMNTEAQ